MIPQYKKPYCQQSTAAGYDDRGNLVPLAYGPALSDEEEITLVLADHDIDNPALVEAIDDLIEVKSTRKTADFIRWLLLRFPPGTAAHAAILRLVLHEDHEPLRETAAKVGCTHVAILKNLKKIAEKLGVTKCPYC